MPKNKSVLKEFDLLESTSETKDFIAGLKLIMKEAAKIEGRDATIYGRDEIILCGNFAHEVDEDFMAQLESLSWSQSPIDEAAFAFITA